ncbi:MAG: hypothetical protein H7A52_00835 [Akkermansiaceae bacterium]|nr:hypothetical protein [Akkermansiaceae bacterium]
MKIPALAAAAVLLLPAAPGSVFSQENEAPAAPTTGAPPDPFGNLETPVSAKPYEFEVDRDRGSLSLAAKDGQYAEGSHFANWNWTLNAKRWGRYFVKIRYTSTTSKIGVQLKVGETVLKSYAPRSGGHLDHQQHTLTIGYAYLDRPGEYPVMLLTGDKSNGPLFFLKAVEFTPAPESDEFGQSIDGTIELHAKNATTFAENMRFEPKPEKNCLGFWTQPDDWAEWTVDVTTPGKFKVDLVQGCGDGNGGSEVALMVNDQTVKFKVEETGGFQSWKNRDLGVVELPHSGEHRIALKPLNLAGKAVMDVQKIVLTPVKS